MMVEINERGLLVKEPTFTHRDMPEFYLTAFGV